MGLGRMNYGGSISSCKANPKPAQSLLRNDNEIVNPRLPSFFGQNVIFIFNFLFSKVGLPVFFLFPCVSIAHFQSY